MGERTPDQPSWSKKRAEEITARIGKLWPQLAPHAVPAIDQRGGWTRGRFVVSRLDDGEWELADYKYSGVITFPTRTEAEEVKKFAVAYVRKWGDINFFAFPYDLDQSPIAPTSEDSADLDPSIWEGP